MEGSVAAAPAGAADGQAQAGQQGADGQAQAFDPSAINDTLAQLATGQEQLYSFLQQQPWAQADGGEAAADTAGQQDAPGIDLSFLESDQAVSPDQVGGLLDQAIQQAVEQRAAALVEPVNAQVQELVQQQEAEALAREFPDLQNDEVAASVLGRTQQVAQALGRPELGTSMRLARLVYMAGRAADLQQQAGQQQDASAATLEGAAGARPGGGGQGGLTAQTIVGANRRGSVLPFG